MPDRPYFEEVSSFELSDLQNTNIDQYPFLIESVNSNDDNHYSILFAFPQEKIISKFNDETKFLDIFPTHIAKDKITNLPFTGGWFVFLGYELIKQIEPVLASQLKDPIIPLAIATRIPTCVIFDHQKNQTIIFDESSNQDRLNQIKEDIRNIKKQSQKQNSFNKLVSEDGKKYIEGVNSCKEYIRAGDVFQVNLSRNWSVEIADDFSSSELYERLKNINPAPFSAFAHFNEFDIISSSPERLFAVDGAMQTISTRPIAGTHPRGEGNQDQIMKENLISHPKEKAEHLMLIDLERNDLGRICEYGSIKVDEFMTLETYPYVHHIVSNVSGKLRDKIGFEHIVKALFPGGTITGCPKIRCMEIIAELEKMPRGVYTGSLGYVSNNGNMDFNILIRTFTKIGERLEFRTGAGIVSDSNPEKELEETIHKAEGLLRVLNQEE